MPRKARVLTNQELVQVEALASVLTTEQIADYLGMARQTFYDIMQRQKAVAVHYKRGKAKAIGFVSQGLLKKARDGDTSSAIFYLKTQAGWKETTVHENKDVANEFSDEELNAKITSLISKLK